MGNVHTISNMKPQITKYLGKSMKINQQHQFHHEEIQHGGNKDKTASNEREFKTDMIETQRSNRE